MAEAERKAKILAEARAKVRIDLANRFRVSRPTLGAENLVLKQKIV